MHSAVENQQDLQAAFLFQYSTPHQDNEIYHAELQSGILIHEDPHRLSSRNDRFHYIHRDELLVQAF